MMIKNWNDKNIEKIKKFRKIYLYGAGDWARRLYIWCNRNDIGITAFIVSTKENNPNNVFGIDVRAIDEVRVDRDSLVIIAIKGKIGEQLYKKVATTSTNAVWLAEQLPDAVEGLNYFAELKEDELKYALESSFTQEGHMLDLNNPLTFNEKIQWLKIYGNRKLMSDMADKYKVREIVADRIGEDHLIKLLGVWDSFDEIDFSKLPDQFVLKCNHGCGYNIIVKNKDDINIEDARTKINQWMNEDYGKMGFFEEHYSLIERKIIAEQYIEQLDGGLYDYKVHCFGGKPRFIQLIGERNWEKHTGRQFIYDADWKVQNWTFGDYPRFEHEIPKPECLEKLLNVAEKMSKGLPYVRVDLYVIENKVLFGEMTLTPAGGSYQYNNEWTKEVNIMLGKLIELPAFM